MSENNYVNSSFARPDYNNTPVDSFGYLQRGIDTNNYNDQGARNNVLQNLALSHAQQQDSEWQQDAPNRIAIQDLAGATAQQGLQSAPLKGQADRVGYQSTIDQAPSATQLAIKKNLQNMSDLQLKNYKDETNFIAQYAPSVIGAPGPTKQVAYGQMLEAGKAAGVDVSKLPTQWTPDVDKTLDRTHNIAMQSMEYLRQKEIDATNNDARLEVAKIGAGASMYSADRGLQGHQMAIEASMSSDKQFAMLSRKPPSTLTPQELNFMTDYKVQKDPVINGMKASLNGAQFMEASQPGYTKRVTDAMAQRYKEIKGNIIGKKEVAPPALPELGASYMGKKVVGRNPQTGQVKLEDGSIVSAK